MESPLIFVLFLKGKQNKKENPKCDSLFGKGDLRKKSDQVWGSGYLSGRYGTDRSTLLSPKSRVSTNEMKLTRQSICKSMGTQINHAHTRIKTYIKNDRDEGECVPRPQAAMC